MPKLPQRVNTIPPVKGTIAYAGSPDLSSPQVDMHLVPAPKKSMPKSLQRRRPPVKGSATVVVGRSDLSPQQVAVHLTCAGARAERSAGAETYLRLVEKREAEDEIRENAVANEIEPEEGAEEEMVAAADETPDLGMFAAEYRVANDSGASLSLLKGSSYPGGNFIQPNSAVARLNRAAGDFRQGAGATDNFLSGDGARLVIAEEAQAVDAASRSMLATGAPSLLDTTHPIVAEIISSIPQSHVAGGKEAARKGYHREGGKEAARKEYCQEGGPDWGKPLRNSLQGRVMQFQQHPSKASVLKPLQGWRLTCAKTELRAAAGTAAKAAASRPVVRAELLRQPRHLLSPLSRAQFRTADETAAGILSKAAARGVAEAPVAKTATGTFAKVAVEAPLLRPLPRPLLGSLARLVSSQNYQGLCQDCRCVTDQRPRPRGYEPPHQPLSA